MHAINIYSDLSYDNSVPLQLTTDVEREAKMLPPDRAREMVVDGMQTVKEAAAFLGVSVATLYGLMARGDLPFVKLGRSRRIPRRALVDLAAKNLIGRGDT
jgi:excisionase family DNA binding protein